MIKLNQSLIGHNRTKSVISEVIFTSIPIIQFILFAAEI